MARCVHLTSVHPPRDTRIQKECQTLAKAGYEVTLIVPTGRNEVVGDIRISAVPKPRHRAERMTLTAWRVYHKARGLDADLYHIHDPELLPWAQLLRSSGASVIYDMHENVPGSVTIKQWLPSCTRSAISNFLKVIERPLVVRLDVIFAEASYRNLYPRAKSTETILNMPMADRLVKIHGQKYTNPTLGYMGAVGPVRGSLVILEALRRLKQRGENVHWECLGPLSTEHRSEMDSRVAAYGLENVSIRGYALPDEGWPIIARCHIGMAVLKATPNSVESYPTKMFEYMALGMPVVVSDFPLYRQVVEGSRCGLCVDPENPAAIAEAISWLLDRPAEAQAMGKRGQQAVLEQYNWDSQAHKLLAFYNSLLKRSR